MKTKSINTIYDSSNFEKTYAVRTYVIKFIRAQPEVQFH